MVALLYAPFSASTPEWITAISGMFAAIGTVAAVVLVLWREEWRVRRTRPILALDLPDTGESDAGEFGVMTAEDFFVPVVVNVSNRAGARTARDVEVLLSVEPMDDRPKPATRFRDQPLPWLGVNTFRIDIPPGVARQVVVCYAGNTRGIYGNLAPPSFPWSRIPEDLAGSFLKLAGAFPGFVRDPGTVNWILPRTTYSLSLKATAAGIESTEYAGEILMEKGEFADVEQVVGRFVLTPLPPT